MVYLFHAMPQLAAAELHGVFQPDTNLQPHLTIRRNTTGYLDVITHGTTFDRAIRDRMATGLFHVPGRGNVLFGLGAELALHVAYRPGSEFAVGPRDGEYLAVAGWPSRFVDLRVNPAGPLYAGHQQMASAPWSSARLSISDAITYGPPTAVPRRTPYGMAATVITEASLREAPGFCVLEAADDTAVTNASIIAAMGYTLQWDAGCWTLTRGDAVILSGASQSEAAAAEAACLDLEEMGHVLNN